MITYNPDLRNKSDHIRLALGDNDTASAMLNDEEINAKITAYGYSEALAQCADALATILSKEPDVYGDDGGIKIEYKQRINTLQRIADKARAGFYKSPGEALSSENTDSRTSGIGSELMQAYKQRQVETIKDY